MNLLVVLTDGWGYTYGGINVFNREMCRGFSRFVNEHMHVICLAPEIHKCEITGRCQGTAVHDVLMLCITLRKIPETG